MMSEDADREDLIDLNRLPELLLSKAETPRVSVAAATRLRTGLVSTMKMLQSDIIQCMRSDRIRQAQN